MQEDIKNKIIIDCMAEQVQFLKEYINDCDKENEELNEKIETLNKELEKKEEEKQSLLEELYSLRKKITEVEIPYSL